MLFTVQYSDGLLHSNIILKYELESVDTFLLNVLQPQPDGSVSVKPKHNLKSCNTGSLAKKNSEKEAGSPGQYEAYLKLAGFCSSCSFKQALAFCVALFSTSPFSSLQDEQVRNATAKTMGTLKKNIQIKNVSYNSFTVLKCCSLYDLKQTPKYSCFCIFSDLKKKKN